MSKADKIIKDCEDKQIPYFVITAKDGLSVDTINGYKQLCQIANCDLKHINDIDNIVEEFINWQDLNEGIVKKPD